MFSLCSFQSLTSHHDFHIGNSCSQLKPLMSIFSRIAAYRECWSIFSFSFRKNSPNINDVLFFKLLIGFYIEGGRHSFVIFLSINLDPLGNFSPSGFILLYFSFGNHMLVFLLKNFHLSP